MEETLIEFQFEQLAKSQQVLSVGNAISQDFNWIWLQLRAYSIYIYMYIHVHIRYANMYIFDEAVAERKLNWI